MSLVFRAKHQNAMAKRAIQTIIYMARTFMAHIFSIGLSNELMICPCEDLAVKHAAWVHNCIPNQTSGSMFLQRSYRAPYSMLSWCVGFYTGLVYDVVLSWQRILVGQMESEYSE